MPTLDSAITMRTNLAFMEGSYQPLTIISEPTLDLPSRPSRP
jgi:hypothetical protein